MEPQAVKIFLAEVLTNKGKIPIIQALR